MSKAMIPNVVAMLKEKVEAEDQLLGTFQENLEQKRYEFDEELSILSKRVRDQAHKVEQMTIAIKVLEHWV